MKSTKLILVDGIPGSGKSTTTQNIAMQLERNGIPCQWMHEEMRDHPLYTEYEEQGSIKKTDVDDFISISLKLWGDLAEKITVQDKVFVIESFLYQSTARILFMANVSTDRVIKYVNEFYDIIRPLNPIIIYLYKDDIDKSFKNIYAARGERWKQMFIDYMKDYIFFQESGLSDEEGTLHMWDEYQKFTNACFDECPFEKIRFETSNQNWDYIYEEIAKFLFIHYYPSSFIDTIDPDAVCGIYSINEGEIKSTIRIKFCDGSLYCESFWPFIKLTPINYNTFQLRSFPIEFKFVQNDKMEVTHIEVSGTYDWSIMGRNLIKIS